MRDLLASALASLPNIRTVAWTVHEENSSAWEQNAICHFLNRLIALEDLRLSIQGIIDFSLLQVSGLRRFRLMDAPSWQTLFMNLTDEAPMYQDISHLVAQNRLTCLHLHGTSNWFKVWSMLRITTDPHIKLTEITTNIVTSEFFHYLTSYSGLEKLTLIQPDGGNRDRSDRLADTFFETLPPPCDVPRGALLPRGLREPVQLWVAQR
ncbi:hypothetical protein MVEN_02224800 [Mycena venus]|uniref:Uncharacterized protein n=1 Tax=Mycena venus TaxID=2733690 RepID=A0A8H7CFF7_9AGAR|nr:hypothetical protein MVEN_02224800 [Mycena venus]